LNSISTDQPQENETREFKHAEPFPTTELSPSERKAYWEWKQRKIKDYSSLGL